MAVLVASMGWRRAPLLGVALLPVSFSPRLVGRSLCALALSASLGLATVGHAAVPEGLPGSPAAQPGEIEAAEAAGVDRLAVSGARALNLSPAYVVAVREGLEMLYRRAYTQAREHFHAMEDRYPGTALGSVADILVWQAIMLENYDYRHDDAYRKASAEARATLAAAQKRPGNEGWESLMMTAVSGLESIHAARKGKYLAALSTAFEAIDHVEATRAAAPDLVDLQLADGLYNYWRTALTDMSSLLPSFGDHKAEGIAQMQAVERDGVFLAAPATLSLAYTWFEEKDNDKLLAACLRNHERYPDNIINETMVGIAYMQVKQLDEALATFDRIMAIDPTNTRVVYWRGRTFQKMRRFDIAEQTYIAYLALDGLEDSHRSWTHYRLGQLHEAQKAWAKSEAAYRAAVKVDGHKHAKAGVDRVKKKAKDAQ